MAIFVRVQNDAPGTTAIGDMQGNVVTSGLLWDIGPVGEVDVESEE